MRIYYLILLLISANDTFADLEVPEGTCNSIYPKITIPENYLQCSNDSDCIIYKEGCRSCGCNFSFNKKFEQEIIRIDKDLRDRLNIHATCEACSLSHLIPICVKNKCSIK